MRLALGPALYYWDRDTMLKFYEEMADSPVDIVYLGETVCSRRHLLRLQDYLDMAARLAAAGKEVVLSTQTLIESENDLKTLRKIADNGNFRVEANDMGAVRLLANKAPFVAGSTLNIYNPQTLDMLAGMGAARWVIPVKCRARGWWRFCTIANPNRKPKYLLTGVCRWPFLRAVSPRATITCKKTIASSNASITRTASP